MDATCANTTEAGMRIELTYTPDCPNVATVRERLRAALRRTGRSAAEIGRAHV